MPWRDVFRLDSQLISRRRGGQAIFDIMLSDQVVLTGNGFFSQVQQESAAGEGLLDQGGSNVGRLAQSVGDDVLPIRESSI